MWRTLTRIMPVMRKPAAELDFWVFGEQVGNGCADSIAEIMKTRLEGALNLLADPAFSLVFCLPAPVWSP